ncbi:CaiB/BaiF CoA-transferase family protein, partial [Sphingomonas sp.]|uniref:CaiB/BaiF CoA transferase family protein n=1 Tax=Sphingomonas sp. TaxID=28214 RepID=UPI0025F315C1
GPPFVHSPSGENLGAAYFHSCNRGKRSMTIDIATAAGQDQVRALAAGADVVIENYKVGGLARYGLDYPGLSAINPALVYCSITGFGQTGPYADRPGYDFIVQGMAGMMSISGEPDGPPQKGGVAYADILTGVYATVAVLAALRERDRSGKGAHVDMALLDTLVSVLGNQALNWMVSGVPPRRMGNGHINLVPYQSFPCSDGDVIIAVGNDRQFARLCALLDVRTLADDARFRENPGRVQHRAELVPLLETLTRGWQAVDLYAALQAHSIPAGPINRIDQAFADPQVIARGMAIEVEDLDGLLPGLAQPIVIDGVRPGSLQAAPRLDGDNDADWAPR